MLAAFTFLFFGARTFKLQMAQHQSDWSYHYFKYF